MAKKTLTMLPPIEKKPCPAVIAAFRAMLEKAEAGEIDGLALCICYPPSAEDGKGTFGSLFIGNPTEDILGFLGIMRVLEARIMSHVDAPEFE